MAGMPKICQPLGNLMNDFFVSNWEGLAAMHLPSRSLSFPPPPPPPPPPSFSFLYISLRVFERLTFWHSWRFIYHLAIWYCITRSVSFVPRHSNLALPCAQHYGSIPIVQSNSHCTPLPLAIWNCLGYLAPAGRPSILYKVLIRRKCTEHSP